MSEIKLKPCPFCGGEAVIHVSDGVCVICKECGCQTISLIDGNSQGKSCGGAIYRVIDKWNRRAGEQDEEITDKEAVAYYNGLSEAWDAARKIVIPPNYAEFSGSLSDDDLQDIFGTANPYAILIEFSALEVIEKISDYEKKKEKMFCAGDVIQNKENPEIIAVVTFADFDGHFDAIKLSESDKYGEKYGVYYKCDMSFWEKTGKHFDLDELFQVNQKAGRR